MMKSSRQVVCQLTGSVDSAVAALLLKRKGFKVTGLIAHSPYETRETRETRQERVEYTTKKLDIELEEISVRHHQWVDLKRLAAHEYREGRTPDLSLLHTKHIIYGVVRDYVSRFLHTELMATEHYARTSAPEHATIQQRKMGVHLYKGMDQRHDDSALLALVPQKSLRMALFPLGEFDKTVVTHVAESAGLGSLLSQSPLDTDEEFCQFTKDVLKEIPPKPGVFRHLSTSNVLGSHQGVHRWKIGENVQIGGRDFWIAHKDVKTGDIMLVPQVDHDGLYADTLFTALAHWSFLTPYNFFAKHTMDCDFRLHAHDPLTRCQLTVGAHNEWCGNDYIILSSTQPIRCITPGHFATFYKGDEVIGSANILRSGPSHFAMNPSKRQTSSSRSSSNGSTPFFTPFRTWYKKLTDVLNQ